MTNLKNIAVAFAALVIFSNITRAQAVKAVYSVNTVEPLQVKYLGDDGSYLIFQVTLQTNEHVKGKFAIEGEEGENLYSTTLASNFKVQTIKIERFDDGQVLGFKLVLGKKTYSKSFSVNTKLVQTTTVAERDITRL